MNNLATTSKNARRRFPLFILRFSLFISLCAAGAEMPIIGLGHDVKRMTDAAKDFTAAAYADYFWLDPGDAAIFCSSTENR